MSSLTLRDFVYSPEVLRSAEEHGIPLDSPYIASGSYARTYDIGNNRVLRVGYMYSNWMHPARTAQMLIATQSEVVHLPRVYESWVIDPDGQLISNYEDTSPSQKYWHFVVMEKYQSARESSLDEDLRIELMAAWEDKEETIQAEMDKILGVQFSDNHVYNFGFDNNKTLVVFDVW